MTTPHQPPSTEELERWKNEGPVWFPKLRLIAEVERLRGENEEAAEAFEQLACNFPSIQVDCNSPIAAAQRINGECARLTAENEELRKDKERLDGLIDIIKHNFVSLSYSFNGYVNAQYGCGACFTGHTDFRVCLDAMIDREKAIDAAIQKGQQ